MSKRSISVKALVEDIGRGLPDAELMHRHELSPVQLQRVFAQLLRAGYVGREVLDARKQGDTKTSSEEFEGTEAPGMATQSRSSESPRPVPIEAYSPGLSDNQSGDPGAVKSSSRSLPYTREQASRFRRNGLILILASFGFVTMAIILRKLGEGAEVDAFPTDEVGAVLHLLASLGWIVTSVLGCFWRLRGLGQSGAWGILAPVVGLNLLVVEALPNRYEPQSDLRVLRVALAVGGIFAWGMALSQIIKHLWGL